MKYAQRWKVLMNAIRIFCTGIHLNNTQTGYEFDDRRFDITFAEDDTCHITDWDTDEIIAIFDSDGSPIFLNAWIQEPMTILGIAGEYPLYDKTPRKKKVN